MRQIVCSTPGDSKKHARPCPRSPILKPQVLQPRIHSSFSFTNEFGGLKNVTKPPAVCCYSFGSPKPLCHLLTTTPIKAKQENHHDETPQQSCPLTPPGILRKAISCSPEWGLPSPSLLHYDFQADSKQPSAEDFFLQPPQLLHRDSARVAKRVKTLNFDDMVDVTDEDFMCLDLFANF